MTTLPYTHHPTLPDPLHVPPPLPTLPYPASSSPPPLDLRNPTSCVDFEVRLLLHHVAGLLEAGPRGRALAGVGSWRPDVHGKRALGNLERRQCLPGVHLASWG